MKIGYFLFFEYLILKNKDAPNILLLSFYIKLEYEVSPPANDDYFLRFNFSGFTGRDTESIDMIGLNHLFAWWLSFNPSRRG